MSADPESLARENAYLRQRNAQRQANPLGGGHS